LAREALRLAANKLPIRCKFIKREGYVEEALPTKYTVATEVEVVEVAEVNASGTEGEASEN
jgi:hypothetical protein